MIDCKAGDVLLVRFPFTEIDASKKRPALALHLVKVGRRSGLATIAMITSKILAPNGCRSIHAAFFQRKPKCL